jgi:Tfp pilus assembly protein PilW
MFQLCNKKFRSGLTFLELLIAMSLMAMVVGTMIGLVRTSELGFEYSEGYGAATQHARVAIDRITRTIYSATANDQFPGCIVIAETVNSWRYPDTLVIWHPNGNPIDSNGLPRYNELVIYCPQPNNPKQLVEITAPSDTRTVPATTDTATWQTEITAIKTNSQSKVVNITDLLRVCTISTATNAPTRGALRFETRLKPSQTDWNNYIAKSIAWTDMPWAQSLYGWQMGIRQVWVRMELQLAPLAPNNVANQANQIPVTFFGSAALYYQLRHQY